MGTSRPFIGISIFKTPPDAGKPILGVPRVAPTAVIGQVAVGIVGEILRLLGHINIAENGLSPGHRDMGPQSGGGVVGRHLLPEIFLVAVSGLAVDRRGISEKLPVGAAGATAKERS